MRQNTIKFQLNGREFRRSTKHVKYRGNAYSQAHKWNVILGLYGYDQKDINQTKKGG